MSYAVDLRTWAMRHHISDAALRELGQMLGAQTQADETAVGSEARVQSQVRLAAPGHGMRLWRNNVGALLDKRDVPVRYGLANDTPALNKRLKSGDLIGWRRLLILPEMVGSVVAQFTSLECKHAAWKYSGDEHEQAQQRWAALVATEGGFARFVTGPDGMA